MWQVGAARTPIEGDFTGLELLGWGQPEGRIRRVHTPLHVRAIALTHDQNRWIYACAEICFITQSLRDGVRQRLADHGIDVDDHELVLHATHTHSGPAGYAHALFYNLSNPGHASVVYESLVNAFVDAIRVALSEQRDGTVHLHEGAIPLEAPVAFNRNLNAYQQNPDAPRCDPSRPETATVRDMRVLAVHGPSGPRAAICWFGVHNTNVHFDNGAIHGDNKGCAAAMLEAWGRHHFDAPDFVGIFAQGPCGDVTPNFRDSPRGFQIGSHDDDFESARANGQIQFETARSLLAADTGRELAGLTSAATYIDYDGYLADPAFTGGLPGRRTGKARYGIGVIEGTAEGPGPLFKAALLRQVLTRTVSLARVGLRRLPGKPGRLLDAPTGTYGPMFPFLEAGRGLRGKAFLVAPMSARGVPAVIDPVVHEVKRLRARGADLETAWTPSIVPLHLTRIGDFTLVSLPSEPTTVAGLRISRQLEGTVQVSGYSNAYHGYLTTQEEYQLQAYEGAHTVFGQWTLAATQTALMRLSEALDSGSQSLPGPTPLRFSAEEVDRRAYTAPPPQRTWG